MCHYRAPLLTATSIFGEDIAVLEIPLILKVREGKISYYYCFKNHSEIIRITLIKSGFYMNLRTDEIIVTIVQNVIINGPITEVTLNP